MSSQVGTAASATSTGSGASWSNPSGAYGSGSPATASFLSTTIPSAILDVLFNGWTIPGGATITGAEVTITRKTSAGTGVVDHEVFITLGTVNGLTNEANVVTWPGSFTVQGYGGASDLWGGTGYTAADINTNGAGVGLTVLGLSAGAAAQVDMVTLAIFYTTGGVPGSQSAIYLGL